MRLKKYTHELEKGKSYFIIRKCVIIDSSKNKFGNIKINSESLHHQFTAVNLMFYIEEVRDWLIDPLATNLKSRFNGIGKPVPIPDPNGGRI